MIAKLQRILANTLTHQGHKVNLEIPINKPQGGITDLFIHKPPGVCIELCGKNTYALYSQKKQEALEEKHKQAEKMGFCFWIFYYPSFLSKNKIAEIEEETLRLLSETPMKQVVLRVF